MTLVQKGDEPAFAALATSGLGDVHHQPGMTLRDYFAAQVMPSIITATSAGQHHPLSRDDGKTLIEAMSRDAYEIADAMLAASETGGGQP